LPAADRGVVVHEGGDVVAAFEVVEDGFDVDASPEIAEEHVEPERGSDVIEGRNDELEVGRRLGGVDERDERDQFGLGDRDAAQGDAHGRA
jgi:hypothetical protein